MGTFAGFLRDVERMERSVLRYYLMSVIVRVWVLVGSVCTYIRCFYGR
jgi:hypothetical protein